MSTCPPWVTITPSALLDTLVCKVAGEISRRTLLLKGIAKLAGKLTDSPAAMTTCPPWDAIVPLLAMWLPTKAT